MGGVRPFRALGSGARKGWIGKHASTLTLRFDRRPILASGVARLRSAGAGIWAGGLRSRRALLSTSTLAAVVRAPCWEP